jgi:outer membrane lipoprotein-sorting protein
MRELIVLGLLLATLAGCRAQGGLPSALPPSVGATYQAAGPLLQALAQRQENLRDLLGRARLTLRTPKKTLSADHVVVLKRPSSLRLEALSPMGQPTGLMVASGEGIRWVDPMKGRHWEGEASAQTLESLVGVPLEVEEMVAILAGALPPGLDIEKARLENSPTEPSYLLTLDSREGRQEIRVARYDLTLLSRARFDSQGQILLEVKNHEFRLLDSYPLPLKIEVAIPSRDISLTIRYKSIRLNQGIGQEMFHLPIPPGSRPVELEGALKGGA